MWCCSNSLLSQVFAAFFKLHFIALESPTSGATTLYCEDSHRSLVNNIEPMVARRTVHVEPKYFYGHPKFTVFLMFFYTNFIEFHNVL